jgi:hypothetical protein
MRKVGSTMIVTVPTAHRRASASLHCACHIAALAFAVIAQALSSLLYCTHAIGAGCLYSYAAHAIIYDERLNERASCVSSCALAGRLAMGGGLPLIASTAGTGMHWLARSLRKFRSFEIGLY